MSSANEVKREFEGKLCEVTADEKYLYNRVMDLEKRNQKIHCHSCLNLHLKYDLEQKMMYLDFRLEHAQRDL